MKIAIVSQVISHIGGILTHAKELQAGMRDIGIECDVIVLSSSGKGGKVQGEESAYHSIFEGDFRLGYGDNVYWDMISVFEKYDGVIHEVIPNKTKNYTDISWQRCFDAKTKHIVLYHDTFAFKRKWLKNIGDRIWAHVGIQEKTKYSFKDLEYDDYIIIRHPIKTDYSFSIENTESFAMAPHNWKSWKRMDRIVKATLYQKYITRTYGSGNGMILAKMRSKDPKHSKLHKVWNEAKDNKKHQHMGFVENEELLSEYRKGRVIIDISQGEMGFKTMLPNINYSTLEGMLHGKMPVISFHEYNMPNFPKSNPFVVTERNVCKSIAVNVDKAMDFYETDAGKEILSLNREYVKNNFDRKMVAKQFLEVLNSPQRKIMNSNTGMKGLF